MNTMPMQAFETAEGPVATTAREARVEVNIDAGFDVAELFFSRTDGRGVIESFNEVFTRISRYAPEELLKAPHRLIRHSDMPKAVFWLLWDGLQRGVPVGAYVKNRAKDGKYYWVFALVSPSGEGYVSVRLKPTSPLLGTVQALYDEILQAERDEGLKPRESAERLLGRLNALGFPTYALFQSHAFYQEFESRRTALKRAECSDLADIDQIVRTTAELRRELVALEAKFSNAGLLTANMKIFAAKLPVGRETVNEIAKNYDLMLRDIQNHLMTLRVRSDFDGPWDVTREDYCFFLLCGAHLMEELCDSFHLEGSASSAIDKDREAARLDQLRKAYQDQSMKAVLDSVQGALTIKRRTDFLRRLILGLSTIRIACRVEAGTLRERAKGLNNIVGRLDEFHDDVEAQLAKIQKLVASILHHIDHSITETGGGE